MNLILNGEKRNIPSIGNVSELLDRLKLTAGSVLVEQNGKVVQRGQFASAYLAEGDKVEILRVVAGG
jgi:thiamine biosynthesis protein ThiS